jgi:hypothetical protein
MALATFARFGNYPSRHAEEEPLERKQGSSKMLSTKPLQTGLVSSALLAATSLYWAISTFTGIEESFSTPDLLAFVGTGAVVVLAQILIILAIDRWLHWSQVTYLVTGGLIVLNAFSFNLAFVGDVLMLEVWLLLLLLAATCSVAAVVVRMANESARLRPFVFATIGVLIASTFIFAALRSDARNVPVISSEFTASPNIRKVQFKTKPNVYFIGFDAAAPAAVLRKYLDLHEAPLPVAFHKNGFRVFPNLFTEIYGTQWSWKILLALDHAYYKRLPDRHGGLMQGTRPSPLIQIFQHNGYEANVLYKNSYFGDRKGTHVDHYQYNKIMSVCDFIGDIERLIGFFGACLVRQSVLFPRGALVPGPDVNFLMHYLADIFKRDKPQVLFAHIHPPFHANVKTFSRENVADLWDFRKRYYSDSVKAGENLALIKQTIIKNDQKAIIFIFGDHGTYVSNAERRAYEQDRSEHKIFFVQDHFGVLGGIYPSHTCADYFDGALEEYGYLTTTFVARLIVQCLAGGQDPFIRYYKHVLFYSTKNQEKTLDPRVYVYE